MEHMILGVKAAVRVLIDDVPDGVERAVAEELLHDHDQTRREVEGILGFGEDVAGETKKGSPPLQEMRRPFAGSSVRHFVHRFCCTRIIALVRFVDAHCFFRGEFSATILAFFFFFFWLLCVCVCVCVFVCLY